MVEEEDLDEDGDARKRKCSRGEYGTEDERWAGRISREGVMEDLAKGCPCGCTDLLNVGKVLEARAEMERSDSEGKRAFTRTYLDDNPARVAGSLELLRRENPSIASVGTFHIMIREERAL